MKKISLSIVLSLLSFYISAQTDTNTTIKFIEITRDNFEKIQGILLNESPNEIKIKKQSGEEIILMKSTIRDYHFINAINDSNINKKKQSNPLDTLNDFHFKNYCINYPNAIAIPKKSIYTYINLYGPQLMYGINNKLSIELIASWIFSPVLLKSKYTYLNNTKNKLALELSLGSMTYLGIKEGTVDVKNIYTVCSKKTNISLASGFNLINVNNPCMSYYGLISLSQKLSNKITFNTEISSYYTKAYHFTPYTYDAMGKPLTGSYRVSLPSTINFTLFSFGVKYHENNNKAIQVSTSFIFSSKWDLTIPIPMITWYRKIN